MHQTADNSFLARRVLGLGLGLGLGLVEVAFSLGAVFAIGFAVGFARGFLMEAFGLGFLVATWTAGVDLNFDFFSVFEVETVAAALASRASLRSRLLR